MLTAFIVCFVIGAVAVAFVAAIPALIQFALWICHEIFSAFADLEDDR